MEIIQQLWEEKNSTEPKKNFVNKSELETNGIMKSTETELKKNECENTGKIWKRNCPKCNIKIIYHNEESSIKANRRNSSCQLCRNKNKEKYDYDAIDGKKTYYKHCPKCNKKCHYTSVSAISWSAIHNKICESCKNIGENNPFFGKTHSKKHKNWLSKKQEKCSFRYKQQGKNPDKIHKSCKFCNKKFDVVLSQTKRKYCCYNCALRDNFGFEVGKMTNPEKRFERLLIDSGITYQYSYPLNGKLYDFYIQEKNILIEIDGIYWHGKNKKYKDLDHIQKKIYHNDRLKDKLAKKNKIKLIRIWEDEIIEKNVSKHLHLT
jgi:G:T-mismatch repair DNA endonuclease (very short patch repair protein)